MPFASPEQRAFMHANHPEIADRWEREAKLKGLSALAGGASPAPDTQPEPDDEGVFHRIKKWLSSGDEDEATRAARKTEEMKRAGEKLMPDTVDAIRRRRKMLDSIGG